MRRWLIGENIFRSRVEAMKLHQTSLKVQMRIIKRFEETNRPANLRDFLHVHE
jgi:hypothetical protein